MMIAASVVATGDSGRSTAAELQMGNRPSRRGCASPLTMATVKPPSSHGLLRLVELPVGLQREIRYAIHRYSNTAYRARWSPGMLQSVVSVLTESRLTTLADPAVFQLAESLPPKGYEAVPDRFDASSTQPGTDRGSRQIPKGGSTPSSLARHLSREPAWRRIGATLELGRRHPGLASRSSVGLPAR